MANINDYLARQEANREAEGALRKAAGPSHGPADQMPVVLATSFKQRDDLPVLTSIRKMSEQVVSNLARMGLHEPVSLQTLPNRWWKANVDAAEVGQLSEYGCAYVTLFMSSDRLARIGSEVVDGPFEAWANIDVAEAILRENAGKCWDATISNRPLLPVVEGADGYAGYDNAYSSEELLAALADGKTIRAYSGPYETNDAAHYALDVRWESPE